MNLDQIRTRGPTIFDENNYHSKFVSRLPKKVNFGAAKFLCEYRSKDSSQHLMRVRDIEQLFISTFHMCSEWSGKKTKHNFQKIKIEKIEI